MLTKHQHPTGDPDNSYTIGIHEVYYDEDGSPNGYHENPREMSAEDIKGMEWLLDALHGAFDKPVLWNSDRFPEEVSKEDLKALVA